MSNIMPVGPLAYKGSVATPYIIRNFPPTSANNEFPVPTIWIDYAAGEAFILTSVALGVANWVLMIGTDFIPFQSITASQTLAINSGYFVTGGALSLALPAVSTEGDVIEVCLDGGTSFTITQSAGQEILLGNLSTTPGVSGTLQSTQQGDWVRLVCRTPNLRWRILGSMGNPTLV